MLRRIHALLRRANDLGGRGGNPFVVKGLGKKETMRISNKRVSKSASQQSTYPRVRSRSRRLRRRGRPSTS